MADWTPPTLISVDQPITAEQGNMFQYNPVAITEGAVGAPRIQDAALGSTVTAAGSAWVQARLAGSTAGGVGSLAFAIWNLGGGSTTILEYGNTVAGSQLRPTNVTGAIGATVSLSGTWRCLGRAVYAGTSDQQSITLFMRVS